MSIPFNTDQFASGNALPVKKIPLSSVFNTQHASVMDESKIERMRKTWNKDMSPPVVAERDGQYFVLDGHHRTEAARRRGHTYLKARISS